MLILVKRIVTFASNDRGEFWESQKPQGGKYIACLPSTLAVPKKRARSSTLGWRRPSTNTAECRRHRP